MPQQMQLFECDKKYRNGNLVLQMLLSRISQGSLTLNSAVVCCQKMSMLNVHDIKDVLEAAKTNWISPEIVELLFDLPCEDHQYMYQKSLANVWVNRSFDDVFTQSSIAIRLKACVTISHWKERGVIELDGSVKSKALNLMLNADPEIAQCMRNTPSMVSLYLDAIGTYQSQFNSSLTPTLAIPLNRIADVLSEQHCNVAKNLFESHLWATRYCENIYAQLSKIQKEKILKNIPTAGCSTLARKM